MEVPGLVEPKQDRARRTLERLLDAAEATLAADGLDAATVPAIAGRAGVGVGTVYKRFADKDALMRAVYLRFFERARTANRDALDPGRWEGTDLAQVAIALVTGMDAGYREHGSLVRGLVQYAENHPDAEFRRTATRLRHEALTAAAALLAARAGADGHPAPERAARTGLLAAALTLEFLHLHEPEVVGVRVADPELPQELAAMILGYLGGDPRRFSTPAT